MSEFPERKRSREPMESDDQVFMETQSSPVFARRDVVRCNSTQATESSAPDEDRMAESAVENLPSLIDDVALNDKETFPPADFTGTTSTTPAISNDSQQIDFDQATAETILDTPNWGPKTVKIGESKKKLPAERQEHDSPDSVPANPTPETSPPQPKLRRKSSSLTVKAMSLPKVNCQERIILCIDHSEEMFKNKFQTQSATKASVFKTLTSAVKQFVCTKSFLNKKHQFSLVMMNDDAQLITDFNPNYEELLFMLNDIAETQTHAKKATHEDGDKVFDLSNLFQVIKQHSSLPKASPKHHGKMPPPHVVRIIFVYGRSDARPKFLGGQKNFALLNNSPYFFIDCVYIHQPVHENNMVESIFTEICSLDIRGTSHVYEVGTDSNMACLYNIFAKLLGHPLQRPKQGENPINYNLELE